MNNKADATLEGILRAIIAVALLLITIGILVMGYNFFLGTSTVPDDLLDQFITSVNTLEEGSTANLQELKLYAGQAIFVIDKGATEGVFTIPSTNPNEFNPTYAYHFQKTLDTCSEQQTCACYCKAGLDQQTVPLGVTQKTILSCDRLICKPFNEDVDFPDKQYANPRIEGEDYHSVPTTITEYTAYYDHGYYIATLEDEEYFLTLEKYHGITYLCEGTLTCVTDQMKEEIKQREQEEHKQEAIELFTQFTQDLQDCVTDVSCNHVDVPALPEGFQIDHYQQTVQLKENNQGSLQPVQGSSYTISQCATALSLGVPDNYLAAIPSTALVQRSEEGICVEKKVEV